MRDLPAIALAVPAPRMVWRAETGFCHDPDTSARDVVRYEQKILGKLLQLPLAFLLDLDTYPASALLWVTFTRENALRYREAAYVVAIHLDIPAYVIATDDDGGFLLFFPDDLTQATGGFIAMADQFEHDHAAQLRAEMKAEIYEDAGQSQAASIRAAAEAQQNATRQDIQPEPPRANDFDDEEERRRAGRGGGGMDNPANASLGANIRPDVVSAPGGLETVTTQKSAEYEAYPEENASDYIRARLAEAERSANQPTSEGREPDTTRDYVDERLIDVEAEEPDPAIQRANEESAKRQDAERAARSGESLPGEESSPASDYITSRLSEAKEAEREAEEVELVVHDHGEGKAPGGGGRGMF